MRTPIHLRAGLCAVLLLHADPARAQVPAGAPGARPRVAVVLSGGGAKGIAHIAVLRVLEEEGIEPVIVTGTSMGAVVGGLYASGYSPSELEVLARSLDWDAYLRGGGERRFLGLDRRLAGERTLLELPLMGGRVSLPPGAIGSQRVSELLSRLTWPVQTVRDFRTLPRAFVAVATDLESGEAVTLDHGSLAEAMLASMSAPSIFPPVRLDGRLLVDGGIVRNLPAQEARALGADVLVCSDVSGPLVSASELGSLVDVLSQAITIQMLAAVAEQRPLCDVYIQPDITGLSATAFGESREALARGSAAAEAARPRLRALGLPREAPPYPRHPPWTDTVRIRRVVVEGATGAAARTARRALRIPDGARVTAARMDTAVKRVYATQLFGPVRYRLEREDGDTVAILTVAPAGPDRLGVGLRYDGTYKASVLLTARLRNRLGFGSATRADLRLGEQLHAGVVHTGPAVGARWVPAAAAGYTQSPFFLYHGDRRVAQAEVRLVRVSAGVVASAGRRGVAGIELRGEGTRSAIEVGSRDSSRTQTYATASLVLRWSSLDREELPRHGLAATLRSEAAVGEGFTQHVAQAQLAVPLRPRVTLLGRAFVGAATGGDDLPLFRRFTLGGAYPSAVFSETQAAFVGLRAQERQGTAAVRLGAAARWELRPDVFATVLGDAGFAGGGLDVAPDDWRGGLGVALGALTPAGPAEVTVSAAAGEGGIRVQLSVGHAF
jgi:NTE family protein